MDFSVEIEGDLTANQRVHIKDKRFYYIQETNKLYPSVSTILQQFPKEELLKYYGKHGLEVAEQNKKDAGARGDQVHQLVEEMLGGQKIQLTKAFVLENPEVVDALTAAINFCQDYNVEPLNIEKFVVNHELQYAGTLDLECWTKGPKDKQAVLTRLDWKTSNYLYPTYDIQLCAYDEACKEMATLRAERLLVVQLGAKTKKGYSVHTVDRAKPHMEALAACRTIFDYRTPNYVVKDKFIPTVFELPAKAVKKKKKINKKK